ncbi:MAG: hypothetical protein IH597_01705 [Bacteroidales bacterium]|nr:hypothetical protein [Bacteroidales bacterium]
MHVSLSSYNYTPLFNLKQTDFITLLTNYDEYIPFGEDNLLPSQLNKLAREVPVHRAILNSKTNYVIGKGLASNNPKINEFIKHPNNINIDLATLMRRVVFDYFNQGNAYIEVVTNAQKTFFYIYHSDASKFRFASSLDHFIIHPNWAEYKGKNDENSKTIPVYPNFEKGQDGLYHSIYHIKDYEPEFYYYGLCSYFAGLRSIIITGLTNVWNQRRLERHFNAPGLLIIPGINDDDDAATLDTEFQKYMGANSEKAADIIIQYLQDLGPGQSSQAAQYIEFLKKEEGNWLALHQQAEMSLITIHNWFRSLTPYSDEKSGFDKNKIIAEYEIAMSSIIRPHQDLFLKHLYKLLTDFNYPVADLDFVNETPIQRINPFKFVWEVRRDSGLDFDPADPVQKQLVIQVRNTYGNDATNANTGTEKEKDF